MSLADLPVCSIKIFGQEVNYFWLSELHGILEKYPELEFPHIQEFYCLLFIDEADGVMVVDNHHIRLESPKTIIIKPYRLNKLQINRKAIGTIICFTEDFFSLRYNNNNLHQFSFLKRDSIPYIRLSSENRNKLTILLQLITEEYKLNKRETQKVLRSYLNIILFELERIYHPIGLVKNKSIKQQKIQEFEKLIDQYFDTKKLPSEYAEMLHVTANYLNKICKEETGNTAGDMIRKRIIIEAERLLHYTNYPVSEIADKLGFENASYFITFFKKQTGITPEQFRKNQTE